jgi:hypothetical protein
MADDVHSIPAPAVQVRAPPQALLAFPQHISPDDPAKRLVAALERLQAIYEPIERRQQMLALGLCRLEGLRQSLVGQLDALSTDENLEHDASDEPWLGWTITGHGSWSTDLPAMDCEADDSEREHTLGWGAGVDQKRLGYGSEDGEPNLGSSADVDQREWVQSQSKGWSAFDGEEECEDEGAQCEGGGQGEDDEDGGQATCIWLRDDDGRHVWPPLAAEGL